MQKTAFLSMPFWSTVDTWAPHGIPITDEPAVKLQFPHESEIIKYVKVSKSYKSEVLPRGRVSAWLQDRNSVTIEEGAQTVSSFWGH